MGRHLTTGCLGLQNLLSTFELLLVVALKQQCRLIMSVVTWSKAGLRITSITLQTELSCGSGSNCKSRLWMKRDGLKLLHESHHNEAMVQLVVQFPFSPNLTWHPCFGFRDYRIGGTLSPTCKSDACKKKKSIVSILIFFLTFSCSYCKFPIWMLGSPKAKPRNASCFPPKSPPLFYYCVPTKATFLFSNVLYCAKFHGTINLGSTSEPEHPFLMFKSWGLLWTECYDAEFRKIG